MGKQPQPRTNTAALVLAAVTDSPGSTAVDLATATHLGKSTVSKILSTLETNRTVRREPGGRDGARRLPDHWSLTNPTAQPAGSKAARSKTSNNPRLAKGELGGMVLDYLTDHPDQHLGPTAIGRALERSQGAIANALTRLVATGHARQTHDAPRRYQINPDQ